MQTFSLSCFSSSNRVGGVAHDCVKTALKPLFPDYKLPFALDREFLAIPNGWRRNLICFFICEKSRTCEEGGGGNERTTRTSKPQISKQIYMGVISSDSLSKNAWVHLFNSGFLSHSETFLSYFGFLIFPSLSDYFPLGELIRTFSERK